MKMKREAKHINNDKVYFNTASNIEYKLVSKNDGNWMVYIKLIECIEKY